MLRWVLTISCLLCAAPVWAQGTARGFVGPPAPALRCTVDGRRCIGVAHYIPDTCALIAHAADEAGLDPGYFARLLWRESRYDPAALSPAGAQGIAQFMPGTAKLRGLADPYNPAQAIEASARYLAEMRARFGNLGLAAVGYNGGEDRARNFIAGRGGLAGETIAYVRAITGHSAEDWRDNAPEAVDYRLDGDTPFLRACTQQAESQKLREFRDPVPPWGVIVAAGRSARIAQNFGRAAARRNSALIDASKLRFVRATIPGFGRRAQYTAQLPAESREAALKLCNALRSQGGFCKMIGN
ncbi:lytic transglycosylase [Thioclava dalianensis]|uniref:Lytic transglycosylase n=1 Tax=Thioclava dalianensis TaxID=1185766 RepID=A0A074TEJ4_9RHOB|nr:lytic transglycosylase domain-containing protein [Thioclava dalianensis]KEP70171.1 lytic transglycosylase [Thioclava dalianensis]SFM81067.1 Transglycosylase SLT domain-containing protein [Thioclava dalianensis]